MRNNFRANERRGSLLTISNAAESQGYLMRCFLGRFVGDRFARHLN